MCHSKMENKRNKHNEKEKKTYEVQCRNCTKENEITYIKEKQDVEIKGIFCKKCGERLLEYIPKEFKQNQKKLIKYIITKRSFWFKLSWLAISTTFALTLIITTQNLIMKINAENKIHALLLTFLLIILTIKSIYPIVHMPRTEYIEEED